MDPEIVCSYVQSAASERGDPAVPREYIIQALGKIARGEVEVTHYPNGAPSLKEVYGVAAGIQRESATA